MKRHLLFVFGVRNLRKLLLPLLAICFLGGCERLPPNDPIELLSIDKSDSAVQRFDHCQLTFQVKVNSYPDTQLVRKSYTSAFKIYQDKYDQITYSQIYQDPLSTLSQGKVDLTFIFTDTPPSPFRQMDVSPYLLDSKLIELTSIARGSDGHVDLYLKASYSWNPELMTHVFGYLIGKAIGLKTSSNPVSILYPEGNQNNSTTLTDEDVALYKALYKCDDWIPLNSKLDIIPFSASRSEISCSTTESGYVLQNGDEGDEQNEFWQYTPGKGWSKKARYPVVRDHDYLSNKSIFVLNNNIYAGDSYSTVLWKKDTSGRFYLYNSIKDRWDSLGLPRIPQVGYMASRSFSMNNIGYIVTMFLYGKNNRSDSIVVNSFNPVRNKWSSGFIRDQTNNNFHELYNTLVFAFSQQAYLISASDSSDTWRFSPYQQAPWDHPASIDLSLRKNTLSKIGFSINTIGYGLLEKKDQTILVLKYSESEHTWTNLKNFPGKGHLMFSFVIGNRAYVGTDRNEFWMYKP